MDHKIIAFANQKGGVGKTTCTINTASELAKLGHKVLVVDLDPQGSLSMGLGIDIFDLGKNIYSVLVEKVPIKKVIRQISENLDIVPTDINLAAAELDLYAKARREDKLKNALSKVVDDYDFILIDCPPSLGLLTINAFSACEAVIIPMACDYYSLVGVRLLLTSISKSQDEINEDMSIIGILPTRYDERTNHSKDVLEELKNKLGKHIYIFETVIHEATVLKESSAKQQPVSDFNQNHRASKEYASFVEELIQHG